MSEPTVYYFFCTRCGTPEKKGLVPKQTLRIRYIKVDIDHTLHFACVCMVCMTPMDIPWTVEETMDAAQKAQGKPIVEDEIESFLSQLDQMGTFGEEE